MTQQLVGKRSGNEVPYTQSGYTRPPTGKAAMTNRARDSRIRLLLLDSYSLFRSSLARFLESEADLDVVGECGTAADALEIISSAASSGPAIDVVLLDFDIDEEQANDFISSARQAGYQGRFLIVAGTANIRKSAIALQLGASGIFLKSEAPDRLVQAIRLVGSDGMWVDKGIIRTLADGYIGRYPGAEDNSKAIGPLDGLDRKVLQGIVEGQTNRKIGESLGLSESKIKNTVQRLFARAGVNTRGQLVRAALEGSMGDVQDFIKRHSDDISNPHH